MADKSKIQPYYIYKFHTERLKDNNYNIKIMPHLARKNGEVISIGASQMLKSLQDIKGVNHTKDEIDKLFIQKRRIKTNISTKDTILALRELEQKIDNILFIPEIISIVVDDVRHYEEIIKSGLFINNHKFVRLMCSAGQMRRNSVILIDSKYEEPLKQVLNNDRKDILINPSKFNAYFALSSSTALKVSRPYFCVVPDLEIQRKEMVDRIEEKIDGDDIIIEEEVVVDFNLFDGQGIISPRQARKWSRDLGLDYVPSAFIVRSNFIKGLVVVMDFVKFSDEIGKHFITDVYGNQINVREADIILTQSQFKLWEAFDSIDEYDKKSKTNGLEWWVSRYSPREENRYTFTNYQFLQALNLKKNNIPLLCSKTVEYFNNTIKNEINYTLLYLLGKNCYNENIESDLFDKVNDTITRTLILNNKLIDDPYVQSHIVSRLNRRIRESYIGKLLIEGFYTFAIADPYAFLEYIFDLPVNGLLKRSEHYNKFYANKGSKNVVSMRAPLTWRSEINPLNIVWNDKTEEWYQYINTGVILNVHGVDCMLMADSDFDGDIICLTDEPEIVNNTYGGYPIHYKTNPTSKEQITEENLYKYDIKGFNPKIGFLTNISTTMYAMLPNFLENSSETTEIVRRLKQCRKEQGSIIDSAKGLIVRPLPSHWTRWTKIDKEKMSSQEISQVKFNNSIVVDKRPLFMIYLYDNYFREWKQFEYNYNIYCIANFGITLNEILKVNANDLTQEQINFIDKYYHFNPFLNTNCVINQVSRYMQSKTKEIKISTKVKDTKDVVRILRDIDIPLNKKKLKQLYNLYKRYKSEKRNLFNLQDSSGEQMYKTLEQYNKAIRKEACTGISSNIKELANLAIIICYEMHPSDNKSFAWNVFGEGIVQNVKKNRQEKVRIPILDNNNGDIDYLGNRYSMVDIEISEEEGYYDFL